MRRVLAALLGAAAILIGLPAAPPATATVTAPATAQLESPFLGHKFHFQQVCVVDHIGNPSVFNVGWTTNTWESGTATVEMGYRTAAQGCNDYPAYQRLRFYLYNAADGHCGKITGTWDTATSPINPYYTKIWDSGNGGPAVWVNQYYSACDSSPTRISNNLASLTGVALGLGTFLDAGEPYDVMNDYSWSRYNIAGAWARNRNRLYLLMN